MPNDILALMWILDIALHLMTGLEPGGMESAYILLSGTDPLRFEQVSTEAQPLLRRREALLGVAKLSQLTALSSSRVFQQLVELDIEFPELVSQLVHRWAVPVGESDSPHVYHQAASQFLSARQLAVSVQAPVLPVRPEGEVILQAMMLFNSTLCWPVILDGGYSLRAPLPLSASRRK